MTRRFLSVLIAILAALITGSTVLAGGWAVISLDSLPSGVAAGQPMTIGFTVRQHGITPLGGLDPEIRLTNSASGESLTVNAVEQGENGHYSATLTLPESGSWRWSIEAFGIQQPMPELFVAEPDVQASSPSSSAISYPIPFSSLLIGLAGMAAAAIGLVYLLRRRSRWATTVMVLGILVGVAGFARAGIAAASSRAAESEKPAANPAPDDLSEQGESVFIAKGCLSCHINSRVDSGFYVFSTETGPNLTQYKTSPEYLHLWLSDPAAVKPETQMPDLELSDAEIEALTAFLLGDSQE